METNRFLLIGGESNTALTFQRLAGSRVEVVHLPAEWGAPLPDFQRVPLMVAVVANEMHGLGKNLAQIEAARAQFPCVPMLVASDSCDTDFINSAWELGIRKFVKWPILEAQITPVFDNYLRISPILSAELPKNTPSFFQKIQQFLCADRASERLHFIPPMMQKWLAWPTEAAIFENRPTLHLFLFGKFKILANEKELTGRFSEQKILRTILVSLVLNGQTPMPRRQLADAIWDYFAGKTTFDNLGVRICHLRKLLSESLGVAHPILFENDCYRLNPMIRVRTDLAEWVALWQRALDADAANDPQTATNCFEKMFETAAGAFLEDGLPSLEMAENWQEMTKEVRLATLDRLSLHYLQTENLAACVEICRLALQTDPLQQLIHRRLICAYFALGQREKAVRQYQKCRAAWLGEFGEGAGLAAETEALFAVLGVD